MVKESQGDTASLPREERGDEGVLSQMQCVNITIVG